MYDDRYTLIKQDEAGMWYFVMCDSAGDAYGNVRIVYEHPAIYITADDAAIAAVAFIEGARYAEKEIQ